jgi:hypothetical protein
MTMEYLNYDPANERVDIKFKPSLHACLARCTLEDLVNCSTLYLYGPILVLYYPTII